MRTVSLICALGTLAFAQTQPPIEASAALNATGGGATITVRNHHTAPLVAFVFVYTLRTAESIFSASTGSYDSAIDPAANKAVPPGEDTKIPYYAGSRGMKPVVNIEAALFADGTTYGHKNMVQTILERRNFAYVTLNKTINELKQAAKLGTSRDQLISQMQSTMNQERSAAGNNELAASILTIRNQVFMDLLKARDPDTGALVPIEKFLPAEIESLNRRRELLQPAK